MEKWPFSLAVLRKISKKKKKLQFLIPLLLKTFQMSNEWHYCRSFSLEFWGRRHSENCLPLMTILVMITNEVKKRSFYSQAGGGGVEGFDQSALKVNKCENFDMILAMKFDSLILKTHFISLWGVSKMHFSHPLRLCYTANRPFLTEQQQAVRKNFLYLDENDFFLV